MRRRCPRKLREGRREGGRGSEEADGGEIWREKRKR
jgi:hypothetical protein